jgi:DNA-binding MarR family transcriptional regulator
MGRLKILASGDSPHVQAKARGKLFENLMADVLRHYGYSIDRIPNVNYAGMEIDIEGKAIATGIPLYAECKCYETEVDSPKLQAFYGKYMALWLRDKRCQGLFIALPGINSHAKGFYRTNCEGKSEITVRLLEEEQVLEAIFQTNNITTVPNAFSRAIEKQMGTPGDWVLLYTDKGLFCVQYVIPPKGGIPSSIALLDAMGNLLSDRATFDYLTQLCPELEDFDKIAGSAIDPQPSVQQDMEEIVEVRGSSACFEYQFPASPKYFVGRQSILAELDSFITAVINKETSSRGILFEASSGWGKSSVILSSVARLEEMGHFAVSIDSRSASSSQFILRVVDYALSKLGNFSGMFPEDYKPITITGFEGAVKALLSLGQVLERNHKLIVIFLDQFENVFFLTDALKRIRDLFLKVCDVQTNVVLGFAWKTDLIGLTSDFPYQLRDAISGSSKRIILDTFSEVEITALLDKLSDELRAPLRKDLIFFLSEFSQGYPWLLKKLCAHVKAQRETGVPQSDIANSLLNVEELFQEDLRGLSTEEEDALRRIAKAAPISVLDLGEEFKPKVVQSLVNARLVVRIGNKYDVYWDIFRDYLNAGRVPIEGNYILRTQVGSVLKATKLLTEANGILSMSEFQQRAGLSEKTFYNVAKDMRLLGLAKVDGGKATLQVNLPKGAKDFEVLLQTHLRDRLRRNRLVWELMDTLEANTSLTIDEVSNLLAKWCPYISATEQTWRTYARIFADWMDRANLAIFDTKDGTLTPYIPGTEVRDRHFLLTKRRGGITIPCVQYTPVEKAAIRLVQALQGDGIIDWTGFRKSTIAKALATLEDLGFIVRKTHSITVLPKTQEFAAVVEKRPALFAEGAMNFAAFVTFIDILKSHKDMGITLSQLAEELKKKLNANWEISTAKTNVKIMLNWARHTKLAPGVFAENRRGQRIGYKNKGDSQLSFLLTERS